jgi:hypothetical protein
MLQNLLLWGEIATDRKALMAIHLDEPNEKVEIFAFPKEEVTAELQNQLVAWRNGGEFDFSNVTISWSIPANSDNLLPDGIRVDKPEFILRAQQDWGKKLMGARLFLVLKEEVNLLKERASNTSVYEDELWNKTKELWDKISELRKEHHISREHTDQLKFIIDETFELLKGLKKFQVEKNKTQHHSLVKNFEQQIDAQRARLIYPDELNDVFESLRKIQDEIKKASFGWGHKRTLFDTLNLVFNDLKNYRKTEHQSKVQDRVKHLQHTFDSLKVSIERDKESLQAHQEKLKFYIKGNLENSEWGQRIRQMEERIAEKTAKKDGIAATLKQLREQSKKDATKAEKKQEAAKESVGKPQENIEESSNS